MEYFGRTIRGQGYDKQFWRGLLWLSLTTELLRGLQATSKKAWIEKGKFVNNTAMEPQRYLIGLLGKEIYEAMLQTHVDEVSHRI